MAKTEGQQIYDGIGVTLEGSGNPERGDAVSIDANGQVDQTSTATGSDTTTFVGIYTDRNDVAADTDAGENVSVAISGVYIANVAAGTAAGDELGPGATLGELAAGDDVIALSDEGGTFQGASIPAGYAAVSMEH